VGMKLERPIPPLGAMRRFAYSDELRTALIGESEAMNEVLPKVRECPGSADRLVAYVHDTLKRFPDATTNRSVAYPVEEVTRQFAGVLDLALGVPADEWLQRYGFAA
jgi:hypothetical protein